MVASMSDDSCSSAADLFNHPIIRSCEAPSANGHANARSMAKIASVLASGGTAHGVKLLSTDTLDIAHGNPVVRRDQVIRANTKFTTGGWNIFDGENQVAYNRQGSIGCKNFS